MCHYPRSNLFSTIIEGEMEGMGSRGGDGRRGEKKGRGDGGDG